MLHYGALWDWQQPGGIEIHYMDIFLHVHWLLITDMTNLITEDKLYCIL